jgi:hypothetical protein|tara:strand:+ start:701 stop:829 length:129 start_codon:yes stop_codon:yes gene_type:complete
MAKFLGEAVRNMSLASVFSYPAAAISLKRLPNIGLSDEYGIG